MDWFLEPVEIKIMMDDIHVWVVDVDRHFARVESFYKTLDLRERERAGRFNFQLHGQRYIVAHGLLRQIIGRIIDLPPEAIVYRYGKLGKPYLVGDHKTDNLQFNLSHCEGLVLIGLSRRRRVGVDIEGIRDVPDFIQVARRFFGPREIAALQGSSPADRLLLFYKIWTLKEAYLKGLGCGLSVPLDVFEVPASSYSPALHKFDEINIDNIPGWEVMPLAPVPGYIGAVAGEGRNWKLKCRSWDQHYSGNGTKKHWHKHLSKRLISLQEVQL